MIASSLLQARRHWDEAERSRFFAKLAFFRGLSPGLLEHLAALSRPRSVLRGEAIFLEGDPSNTVHLLASGRVKLVHETEAGREVIIRLIRPGEIIGAAGIWGEPRYPASALAQEDSVVLCLPTAELSALFDRHPSLALAIIRVLSTRLRDAERRICDLQTAQVEQRIANTLLRQAQKTGLRTTRGIELGIRLTRQDLAELSGTTLSTASRTLSGWHQRGIVAAGRERVTILQPQTLATIAEGVVE